MATHPDDYIGRKRVEYELNSVSEEKRNRNRSIQQKRFDETTVNFEDGIRKIDFILCYEKCHIQNDDNIEQSGHGLDKISDPSERKKTKARRKFLKAIQAKGNYRLECETQHWKESPDHKTYYVKVHAPFETLLRGAEELNLRLPIKKNELRAHSQREKIFLKMGIVDPQVPLPPDNLKIDNHFSAPFKYRNRNKFLRWNSDGRGRVFFSSAQRSAITEHILLRAKHYCSENTDDQQGLGALLLNGTFSCAYPLHDGPYKVSEMDTGGTTDRQFLYKSWAHPKNWWKYQPLDHVRRYFGEKVAIYFAWLGYITTFLTIASVAGILIQIIGLIYTIWNNTISEEICDQANRKVFYMCPLCDDKCDFWYLTDSCLSSRVALLFDNGATIIFACFMSLWAVLLLEFWQRKQFTLQFKWSMLNYEEIDETLRPDFVDKIQHYIRDGPKSTMPKRMKRYTEVDRATGETVYILPVWYSLPKLLASFSVLCVMVTLVLGVVFSIILYRASVSGILYILVATYPEGPSVSNVTVSISGAIFQLVFVVGLNFVYERLAKLFTDWELHRTQTDYDDSLIVKVYLFQFVNFYSFIFYIAFFKGNFVGWPGSYSRVGGARLEECATYGCFLELSIQYVIIMVGKQIMNAVLEIVIPYVKRVIKRIRKKKQTEDDTYTQWERDFYLLPNQPQGLLYEYLQSVIQYGFVTLFVSTFPLAPLFALINNWAEIRIDAYKFIADLRRPVAARAQGIGAWYYIMDIVSKLAVITNAWLIAVTANFIPYLVYTGLGYDAVQKINYPNTTLGFVHWSQSNFGVSTLLNDSVGSSSAFPFPAILELKVYDEAGNVLSSSTSSSDYLVYLPFVNYTCMRMNGCYNVTNNRTDGFTKSQWKSVFTGQTESTKSNNTKCRDLLYELDDPNDIKGTSAIKRFVTADMGGCFDATVTCRFRNQVNATGVQASSNKESATSRPISYYQILVSRFAFVIVFEHVVFILGGIIAWLIPDIPKIVQDEIKKERKLGADAEVAFKV